MVINNKNYKSKSIQNNETKKINFWNYLLNKLSCGKIKKNIKIYEDFRIKIISVENIINNFLNTNYILKIIERKENK